MLEVGNLHRAFGLRPVLQGVELSASNGEVVALFGPNGAGKTTLLRICATLLRPDRHPHHPELKIDGFDILTDGREARSRLGYLGHHSGSYPELTATENLLFTARLHGLAEPDIRVEAMLKLVGLDHRAGEPVAGYSFGMVQRLGLARALLHDPTTLLLDEPFQGLDPRATGVLYDLVSKARDQGRAVILATHDIARGLELADRVTVLTDGKVKCLEPEDGRAGIEQVTRKMGGIDP